MYSKEQPKNTINWLNSQVWYRSVKVLFLLLTLLVTVIVFYLIITLNLKNYISYDYSHAKIICKYGNNNEYDYNEVKSKLIRHLDYLKLCDITRQEKLPEIYDCDPAIPYDVGKSMDIKCSHDLLTDLGYSNFEEMHFDKVGNPKINKNDDSTLFNMVGVEKIDTSNLYTLIIYCLIAVTVEIIIVEMIRRLFYYIILGKMYPDN